VIDRLSRPATLLIVDNCEHLIEGCAELVGWLLQECPELTVLATSRESLGVREEHVLRLSSLSESAALALLTQRAAQARRGFTVTAGNSVAVREICRRLESMPLALELAAARLAALSPAQVAALLADTLALLDVGRRDPDARHRTLRAALDWSYQLLEDRKRAAVRKLAVFRGGFTAGAAEAVAGASWELLDVLVGQSLVEADPDTDEPRYRLLEPVRQYTWDLAVGSERVDTQRHHAAWVVAFARQASGQVLLDPRWSERLEAERANIEAAIEWSLGTPSDESALRIVGYLGVYWFTAGHGQALTWIERALDRSDRAPPRLRARALLAGAAVAQLRPFDPWSGPTDGGHPPGLSRSAAWAEQAASIFRQLGSAASLGWALFWEGRAKFVLDQAAARQLFAEALALFRQLKDPLGVGWCLERTADLASGDGRWGEALVLYTELVELGRASGVDHPLGVALFELGRLAARTGDRARAVELTEEAVVHYRSAYDRWQLCSALRALALARHAAGNHQGGADALWESLKLAEEHGFDDQLDWLFRDIALFLPEELNDVARKLWRPLPDWADSNWWPEPTWDEKRQWLADHCEYPPRASSQVLRAAIPLAREALAQIGGGPTQQDS
jgi:predicted ATPase